MEGPRGSSGTRAGAGGRPQGLARLRDATPRPPHTNFAHNFPRSLLEIARKRCNSNDTTSISKQVAGELRAKLLRRRQGPRQTNFACNSVRPNFNKPRKRCNSNDANSIFEQAAGELHAKLMIDSHNWTTYNNPGPGRGAGGRRQGQGGLRDDAPHPSTHQAPLGCRAPEGPNGLAAVPVGGGGAWPDNEPTRRAKLAARTARGRAAAHRHTQRPGPQSRTRGGRARQRGGYRSTRPLSAHSATASSRLRPNDPQSWRRRRIHRNMPPTTAAPRPAPPIRPSKPVRARPFFGLVAGTSGAT